MGTFNEAENFSADINGWDVSGVVDMYYMFYYASNFESDLSGWVVSRVTNMPYMFYKASSFHQNLCLWKDKFQGGSTSFMLDGSGCPVQNVDSENWCVEC